MLTHDVVWYIYPMCAYMIHLVEQHLHWNTAGYTRAIDAHVRCVVNKLDTESLRWVGTQQSKTTYIVWTLNIQTIQDVPFGMSFLSVTRSWGFNLPLVPMFIPLWPTTLNPLVPAVLMALPFHFSQFEPCHVVNNCLVNDLLQSPWDPGEGGVGEGVDGWDRFRSSIFNMVVIEMNNNVWDWKKESNVPFC